MAATNHRALSSDEIRSDETRLGESDTNDALGVISGAKQTRNAWQSLACSPPGIAVLHPERTVAKRNHVLIDAMFSSVAHYSRTKISNLHQFTSMHPKSTCISANADGLRDAA